MNPLAPSQANNLLRLDISPAAAAKIEKARANAEPLVLTLGSAEKKTHVEAPARTAQVGSIVFDTPVGFGSGGADAAEPFAVTFDDIGRYSV